MLCGNDNSEGTDALTLRHHGRGTRPYTISFSVGEVVNDPAANESLSDLVARADHMMYARKRARRLAEDKV